jgi:hypothetical protein
VTTGTFVYDGQQRLIRVERTANPSVEYAYDFDGLRSRSVNGVRTVWDVGAPFAQLLEERDAGAPCWFATNAVTPPCPSSETPRRDVRFVGDHLGTVRAVAVPTAR